MPKLISEYSDPSALRQLMANAKRQKRDDIYWQAFHRLCLLEGLDKADPLHREFYSTLRAYEELLSQKNGRTTQAARTRQKLRRTSVERCLEDWALGQAPTMGFNLLVENGMADLTAEYLVLKYSERFSTEAIEAARTRLQKSGVALSGSYAG